jgi:glycosyltransferase involved in cell wall biosynthesis
MRSPPRVAVTLEQCWHRVPGGTATATLRAVSALVARGHIDLVGVAARHRRPPPAAFAPSIAVKQLPLPRAALYESWHRVRWPDVERATGPVDLTHATTSAIPASSSPLVVTIHDLAFVDHPEWFKPRGLRLFRRGLELTLREADLVLCPSSATIDDCRRAGFGADRLRLVPWGVDASAVAEEDVARVRRAYGLGDGKYVLSVGTLEPRKNVTALLTAFVSLDRPDLALALVGPDGWHQDQPAETEGVRRLGFVPDADLAALYAGAAVFCYPSLMEGFGLPVLEAMAQGTPVVTSDRSSTAEVAGDAALTVDPTSPAAIAAALTKVIDDDGLAAELADAGRARALTFTWDRCAALHEECYAEVAR